MSRLTQIITTALGSVLLFATFAIAGWAITDWIGSPTLRSSTTPWATTEFIEVDSGVRVPKEGVASYPVVPAEENTDVQAAERTRELSATTNYLTDTDIGSEGLGDPAVGGQVFILAEHEHRSDVGSDDGAPIVIDTSDLRFVANLQAEVPTEVIEASPLPLPLIEELTRDRDLGLDGFLGLDICAGMIPGATAPPGCPSGGFGGTIVAISLDILDPVRVILGAPDVFPGCRSDDSTFRMQLITNRPGALTSLMWNFGPGTGNTLEQPPDAVVTAGATPPELDTQWYEQLDDASAGTPRIRFCMEVPIRVDEGAVFHVVLFTSTHEPDDGGRAGDSVGFMHTGSSERRRPPTRMSSTGRDTLSVAAFRDSSQATRMVVQARRRLPVSMPVIENCSPTFDGATPTTPIGSDIQGIPTYTYSFDTSAGDWDEFWGDEWDTMDVFALPLRGAIGYSVCVYELDRDGRVVYAEAADVWVPGTRHVRVRVNGFQTFDTSANPAIASLTVEATSQTQCSSYTVDWPGPSQILVEFGSAADICLFQHADGLRTNGGFFLDTFLTRDGGGVDTLQHWISIPKSELRRLVESTDNYLVTIPLPNIAHGDAEGPSGQATLEVTIGPVGGIERWRFGFPFPFIDL